MPLLQKHASPLWGIWKIDEHWEQLLALSECPSLYRPFLDRCRSASRKAEWLAARMLLRELTGRETAIAYRGNGAPYLVDAGYHISISHTRGYAAVILDRTHIAGIDIEHRSERVQRVKSRFLSEAECAALHGASTEALLVCWSAKEAAFKMTGRRAADFREDLQILSAGPIESCGTVTVGETRADGPAVYELTYAVTPAYAVAYGLSPAEKNPAQSCGYK